MLSFFFFNDTATTEIYTLSLTRRSSDLYAHGPSQDDPGEHPPHHLGGIDRRAAGVLHAEPEQHAQRHGGESEHERQMVQLVQPLERREQPEHRPEALRLELVELQQVQGGGDERERQHGEAEDAHRDVEDRPGAASGDRKSTRLNSSHSQISYAVFCLKKKKKK